MLRVFLLNKKAVLPEQNCQKIRYGKISAC